MKSICFGHFQNFRALQVHQKMSQEIEGSRPVELLVAWPKKGRGVETHAVTMAQWNGSTLEDCLHVENCKKWEKVSVNASVALHIVLHIHFHACVSWRHVLKDEIWDYPTGLDWRDDDLLGSWWFRWWSGFETSSLSTCETTTLWSFKKATENHHVYNR